VNSREKYKRYLERHRAGVLLAWEDIQRYMGDASFVTEPLIRRKIDELIMKHDLSKYSKEEFDPYVQWFYGPSRKKDRALFAKAWKHHYKTNPHHVKYWETRPFDMEVDHIYLVEMACDWIAMGRRKGREPAVSYFNKTRKYTERVLPKEAVNLLEYILITMDKKVRRVVIE